MHANRLDGARFFDEKLGRPDHDVRTQDAFDGIQYKRIHGQSRRQRHDEV